MSDEAMEHSESESEGVEDEAGSEASHLDGQDETAPAEPEKVAPEPRLNQKAGKLVSKQPLSPNGGLCRGKLIDCSHAGL